MSADSFSSLQKHRQAHSHAVPAVFANKGLVKSKQLETAPCAEGIKDLFPSCYNTPRVSLERTDGGSGRSPLRVGVVLSGGQAPGGHNVIAGIYDYLKTYHPDSVLIGFRDGPHGVFSGIYSQIDSAMMDRYRNQGGFDMLGSGRHKIETPEQFANSAKVCADLKLDGLVVIGGDDSNTNASLLAENFKKSGSSTKVIGCPKTIDGDLKNEYVPISFGFDTACRTYAEQVGNLARDALSSQKYYHFVRLMGRSASHVALEVALHTRPNVCLIGEEVQTQKQSLSHITTQLTDLVEKRASMGRNFGLILLPEGLVEFIPEIGSLISEINDLVAKAGEGASITEEFLRGKLSAEGLKVFNFLPSSIRHQLLLDRDPHGNVQVTKIETEQLLAICVTEELARRAKASGKAPIPFVPLYHSFGYEGRSGLPSMFDADYCYALGLTAAGLISCGLTSLMSCVDNLMNPVSEWRCGGVPITMMMGLEKRHGKMKPVIAKALVKLDGAPFGALNSRRASWAVDDLYRCPGPVQFYAPDGVVDHLPLTLRYELLPKGSADPDPSPKVPAPTAYKIGDTNPFLLRTTPMECLSQLEKWRLKYQPRVPSTLKSALTGSLQDVQLWSLGESQCRNVRDQKQVQRAFPQTYGSPMLEVTFGSAGNSGMGKITPKITEVPKVGVVFSGRQAPGGHNVIVGLYNAVKASKGTLMGFVGGTKGLLSGTAIEITAEIADRYKNTGGFDMLGRTVDRLDASHAEKVWQVAQGMGLSSLVVIGSVKTMTNLASLSEKLKGINGCTLNVVGVPAGIDGSLQGLGVEATIGFDTACHGYAQLIGNTATDAASARKYYHFLRVMGTEPSQITLEVALRTHPNVVVLGEEVEHKREGLMDLVREIANLVTRRAQAKKNFGIVVIPEGLASAIPELKALTDELCTVFREKSGPLSEKVLLDNLSPWGKAMLESLPPYFKHQLMLEQTNAAVQLSQIETERLLAELVEKELDRRTKEGTFKGKFSAVTSFLGYQARGAAPSNFDCDLAYSLGVTAACLAKCKELTGYLVIATGLKNPTENWRVGAIPISSLLVGDVARSPYVPVGKVSLAGPAHQALRSGTEKWEIEESYINPGPCQFAGPTAEDRPISLQIQNDAGYLQSMASLHQQFNALKDACRPGCPSAMLGIATQSLSTLTEIVGLIRGGAQSAN